MVSNELAIAKTQSANDLARYEALKAYIIQLGVAYDAARAPSCRTTPFSYQKA
jgi:hypothetical protein